jgi:hypothetical protein
MPCRYVCLLAAGDTKPEVREAGLTGLGLSATQLPADAATAPSAYAAAVAGLGLPLPGAVVEYMVAQHKQLAQPGDLSRCGSECCMLRRGVLGVVGVVQAAGAARRPQQVTLGNSCCVAVFVSVSCVSLCA